MATQSFNWLDKKEYPFQSHCMEIQGHQLHYIDEGKGEVLLFVHGTPSWSFDFRHLIKALSTNYRCIAMDHIGFGLSDKPVKYNYTARQHAQNLQELIRRLELKDITLVVHDFGGPIGFDYALKHPDNIKKLVVFNSWLWSSEQDPAYKKMKKILKSPLLPFLYKYFNFSAKFLLPGSFGDKKLSNQLKKQYTAPFSKPSERTGTIGFARSLLKDQQWFESLWKKIDVLKNKPSLFIWGMKDAFISPAYLEKFSSTFTHSTVLKLETVGHFPQEEAPEKCLESLQKFLRS